VIRAARYLGVPPWEMEGISGPPHWLWKEWAVMAEAAEAYAEAEIIKHGGKG
jgi:hypothetical protein